MSQMPVEARDPETYAIIGASFEVFNELGCGFLEAAYKQALMVELNSRGVPARRELPCPIFYKRVQLDCVYKADIVCFEDVIVEVKAVKQLSAVDRAQVINYLKATGFSRALLINFGAVSLEYERIVLSAQHRTRSHSTSSSA